MISTGSRTWTEKVKKQSSKRELENKRPIMLLEPEICPRHSGFKRDA